MAYVQEPRKKYERASSTPPKLEKRAPKVGGFAANFTCGFFRVMEGWNPLAHIFEVFAKCSLMITDDNKFNAPNVIWEFRV